MARSPALKGGTADRRAPPVGRTNKRREIVQATIETMAELGFAGTSFEKITERIGVSRGLIRHHFRSKAALLEECLLTMLSEFHDDFAARARKHRLDAADRLVLWIERTFTPPTFTKANVSAWFAFLEASNANARLKQIARSTYADYRRVLEPLFAELLGKAEDALPAEATDGLLAMLDGLWLQFRDDPDLFDPAYAQRLCLAYLDRFANETDRARIRAKRAALEKGRKRATRSAGTAACARGPGIRRS